MQFNYSTLLRLTFQHNYYADNLLSKISIKPSMESEKLMKNYGLAWKQFGADLLVSVDGADPAIEYKLTDLYEESQKLQFFVTIDEPYFLNFTDLPFGNFETNAYYFSNQAGTLDKAKKKTRLTDKEFVTESERVNYGGLLFNFVNEKNAKQPFQQVLDIFGNNITKEVTSVTEPGKGTTIDFRNVGSGWYKIVCGKADEIVYYASAEESWNTPFAIVEMLFDKSIPESTRLVLKKGEVSEKHFVIQFNARQVYWKYMVMSPHLQELQGIGIANGKSGLVFTGPEKVEVVEGKEAYVFTSTEPIAVRDYKEYKLQLLKGLGKEKGSGKVVMTSLPVPIPKSIKAKTGEAGKFVSEMFIY